jgi:epoxyqueuosine reductase
MDTDEIKTAIRARAEALGFDAVGFAAAGTVPDGRAALAAYLGAGHHGGMDWMARRVDERASPPGLWPEVRSVIALAISYAPPGDPLALLTRPDRGSIAAYARGRDYHDVIKPRLKQLARWIAESTGAGVKVFVDTAPVMEKPAAEAAGLGWQGKHTNLVSRRHGSWLLLGEVFTTLDLPPDAAGTDHCGTCRACLDACPTAAFPEPGQLDARRCISYLTIELRGPIPPQWRRGMGDWVFGCDVCQAVCPWNREAPVSNDADLSGDPARAAPDLVALLQLDAAGFRERFRHTALARPRRRGLLRNAATALGNLLAGHVPGRASLSGKARDRALAALTASLADAEPLVRGAAAWALGEAGERSAAQALARAAAREADPLARQELDAARQRLG